MLLVFHYAIGQVEFQQPYPRNLDNTIKHITINNGLPSNIITAIVKDQTGFIWIATDKGLCRWDGFSAVVFQHYDSDSSTLIDNRIPQNGLIYDPLNNKLIIGTTKGLSIFDLENSGIRNYYIRPNEKNTLQSPVNSVFIDRQDILWIGTDQGFCRFRQEQNDFINYRFTQNLPIGIMLDNNYSNHIQDIKQDYNNDSILWLSTLAGLLKFDKHTKEFHWFYFPEKDYLRELNLFTMLVPHPNGSIYLGTWNFDMAVFDTQSETFTNRMGPAAHGKNKLPNRILPYGVKSEKEIWISSLEGFGILNTNSNEINILKTFKSLNGARFESELFYVDADNYWLGSEYGVFILNLTKKQISNYFFEPKDEKHWYLTQCIFEDPKSDDLLIGYGRGEGLHFFNRMNHQFEFSTYARKSIMEYNVGSIVMTKSEKIYVLSSDDIYRYNEDDKKLNSLNCSFETFPAFTDMQMDTVGVLWISSGNIGLQKYIPGSNSLETIKDVGSFFETRHSLPLFQELCIDSDNRIWFRRKGESYGYYNPVNDSISYFDQVGKSFDLTSFSEAVNDTIWVATAKDGLGYIDTKNPDQGVQLVSLSGFSHTGTIQDIAMDKKTVCGI